MIKPILLAALLAVCLASSAGAETLFTVELAETGEAFANPMKGFRPTRYLEDDGFPEGEYATVCKQYIKYTDLEERPEDTARKMIEWSDATWAGVEERNLKVIPRVVIVYPDGPDNGTDGYWPEGLDHDDIADRWVNEEYKARMALFIAKLGQAWNQDPRVAAVEMGLWGIWGEHHVWPLSIPGSGQRVPKELQAVLGDAFQAAFPNKKIMVRYAETFRAYDLGFFWDSFALRDDSLSGTLMMQRDLWRTQMMSGEIAYDWGDQRDIGWSPDGTLLSDECTDHVIGWIQQTHTSSLGWVAEYTQGHAALAANAARMQKALGYRYVIRRAAYSLSIQPDEILALAFDVENVGNAPFYYPWPVEAALLNAEREPVWRGLVRVDIRRWLPGQTYTVADTFELPRDLPEGIYTLALAILDPSATCRRSASPTPTTTPEGERRWALLAWARRRKPWK